jgi:hypothetical protein
MAYQGYGGKCQPHFNLSNPEVQKYWVDRILRYLNMISAGSIWTTFVSPSNRFIVTTALHVKLLKKYISIHRSKYPMIAVA